MIAISKKSLSDEQRREYVRIAYYYYKSNLTQEEIAEKLHISRQRINRILSQCLELGIVKISVQGDEQNYIEVEAQLEKKYGLRAVRIAGEVSPSNVYSLLGAAAGKYVVDMLKDGDVLGFSRGRAMSALAENLPSAAFQNLTVTQLMGSWNSQQAGVNVDDIVRRTAASLGADTTMLYAPVVVNKKELRDSIMNEPYFQAAYRVLQSCTIAAVGIGEVNESNIPMIGEMGYEQYRGKNAVGEVCAHFYDVDGRAVETELDERTIVIKLEHYMKIPIRIGVAGLPSKLPAIYGALKGGYINVLVTDLNTAEALLRR